MARIATPLDGVLSIGLKAKARADYSLALRDHAGRVLRAASGSGPHEKVNYTICGQARVKAVVTRVHGGGTFRLTVRRP